MEEIWQDIEGLEGIYQESNLGNVRSLKNDKVLKCRSRHLYCLYKDGKKMAYRPSIYRNKVQDLPNEEWRAVGGYEGIYSVSNYGRVKGRGKQLFGDEELLLKPKTNNRGYKCVCLYGNKSKKYMFVHRLVAQCFIPNPDNLPFVNHKDENTCNNNVDNLEWCTHLYNVRYGTGILRKNAKTERLKKKVLQYSINGEFIREWHSASDAARELGLSIPHISKAARNLIKTHGGYIWKYA